MRIVNTSDYRLSRLKELFAFAARGVSDAGVLVRVTKSKRGLSGWCSGCGQRVTIRIGDAKKSHPRRFWNFYGLKRIDAKWPDGFPFDSWDDAIIYIAAHEFRHVWQAQRRQRTGKRGKGEYDAELFALRRVNSYRNATGRDIIPEVAQMNPFEKKLQKLT